MAGTTKGGEKAAVTNKLKHGEGFYKKIGAAGGRKSAGGGFAADHDRARWAGKLGGMNSGLVADYDCNHLREEAFYAGEHRFLRCEKCRKVRRG